MPQAGGGSADTPCAFQARGGWLRWGWNSARSRRWLGGARTLFVGTSGRPRQKASRRTAPGCSRRRQRQMCPSSRSPRSPMAAWLGTWLNPGAARTTGVHPVAVADLQESGVIRTANGQMVINLRSGILHAVAVGPGAGEPTDWLTDCGWKFGTNAFESISNAEGIPQSLFCEKCLPQGSQGGCLHTPHRMLGIHT